MDFSTIAVKLAGAALLIWTVRSIVITLKTGKPVNIPQADQQSGSEKLLNNILLWAWLAFCVAFGVGMMLNN